MKKKSQKIGLVAALSQNFVIGKDNKIPWDMPEDVAYFKRMTLNKPIIMGRKTFDSIGKPLPNRTNIVVTRDPNLTIEGCIVTNSTNAALEKVADYEGDVMIIGGQTIYEDTLPIADILYLTIIETTVEGDTFFPKWNPDEWKTIRRDTHPKDDANPFDYTFWTLERVS